MNWKAVQQRLADRGYDPGPIDGIPGPRTEAAIVRFKVANGLRARPYVGPVTLAKLGVNAAPFAPDLPWMNEAAKHMGLHERTHFSRLFAWLRSDGAAVGDPRQLPWCGDFVETCIKLTMPDEPFTGRLKQNPYLARNWLEFGTVERGYGAVAVFWRGSPRGLSGHVGFAVGHDPKRGRIRVRGGNQSNSVSDTWLDGSRLLGYRKPKTWAQKLPPLPVLDSKGVPVSRNEA